MPLFFRKNKRFVYAIVVLVVVVFFSSRGADNPAKSFLLAVESPFLKTFRIFSGGFHGFFQFLGSIGDLKSENEKLMKEKQELSAEIAKLEDVENENKRLRKELDLSPKGKYELEAGFAIAQDPRGSGNYLLLDKGSNDGISDGMPVIVSNGILVGKIREVYANESKAALLTDQNSAVNAEITDSGTKGIAKGVFGLGLTLDMISQADVVNEGDTVITSGLGREMPRGLLIGKVGQVSQSPDKLFQQANIIPPVEFSDLQVVFVVKKW